MPDFKKALLLGLGSAAVAFVGYFYRQRIFGGTRTKIPKLEDPEPMQKYIYEEIQNGEILIFSGDIVRGVDHLASAVRICCAPGKLLKALEKTVPAEAFALLLQRLSPSGCHLSNSTVVKDNQGNVLMKVEQ